jgi:hypothetical protein
MGELRNWVKNYDGRSGADYETLDEASSSR